MYPTIFLANQNIKNSKKDVANYIIKNLKNSTIKLDYEIKSLFYNSFSEVVKSLENHINEKFHIIIFLTVPNFSMEELLFIKEKLFSFVLLEDIPEHYNTFYKYSQFLFDGIFTESGYRDFFEVYGRPVYNGEIFQTDLKLLDKKTSYDSLIPFSERLYDFSFIGRFDRTGRNKTINELKNKFKNIYYHDSSKSYISNEKLKHIIRNTKYLLNSTSVQNRNSYGILKFPENMQLQAKSRFMEYAANGCILFSEILPINSLPTLIKKINIPVIEIPRGVNKADYCLNYLEGNINLEELSRRTFDSVYESYIPNNINLELKKILSDINSKSTKYSNHYFTKNEWGKIKTKHLQFSIQYAIKNIINSKLSMFIKFKMLLKLITSLIKKNFKDLSKVGNAIVNLILINLLKIIQKFFD